MGPEQIHDLPAAGEQGARYAVGVRRRQGGILARLARRQKAREKRVRPHEGGM